ncbi:MAG: T9SS type A sorting domain-containing protein, partial [Candidatus Azobacteroides sp.]|nr:T9SS type A sorting domain-containing protein [Candidatus Azobacteroides sp.]
NLQAQQGEISSLPDRDKAIRFAYRTLNGLGVSMDYKKAFRIFKKLAQTGDAEAWNALGMIYHLGLGVEKDDEKAARLFHEAYNRGYAKGAYNLGLAYKYGHGVPQDFDRAFEWFVYASFAGYEWTDYAIGYCWYKGQGVIKQRYDMAVDCFRKGAGKGDAACMYHLGYCYFKGYGVERDVALGKYWMEKAMEKGLTKAVDFMTYIDDLDTFGTEKVTLRSSMTDPLREVVPDRYPVSVTHDIPTAVDGEWEGKIIIYDWSGERIEEEIPLSASFKLEEGNLQGTWIQNDTTYTELNISVTDTAWNFNSMHLDVKRPTVIKEGHFSHRNTENGEYLTGTVVSYSELTREYTEPTFVALRKVSDVTSLLLTETGKDMLRAFPNPFSDHLTVVFTLEKAQPVSIQLFNISGKRIYTSESIPASAGINEVEVPVFSMARGTYLLKLQGENIRKTISVIKE